jgi:hypothetical protein
VRHVDAGGVWHNTCCSHRSVQLGSEAIGEIAQGGLHRCPVAGLVD